MYAKELKKSSSILAYSCEWLGVQGGLQLVNIAKQQGKLKGMKLAVISKFLNEELKTLEKHKVELVAEYGMSTDKVKEEQTKQINSFTTVAFLKCYKDE